MNCRSLRHPIGRLIHAKHGFAMVFAVAIVCSGQAHGKLVTFYFEALEDRPWAPSHTTISGFYTFESTTRALPDYGQGVYFYPDTIRGLQFASAGYKGQIISVPNPKPWNFPTNEITITNDGKKRYPYLAVEGPAYDLTVGFTGNDPSRDGFGFNSFGLTLRDSSGAAPFSNALPLVPPDITRFKTRQVTVRFAVPNNAPFVQTSFFILTSLSLRRPVRSYYSIERDSQRLSRNLPAQSQPSRSTQPAVPYRKDLPATIAVPRQCSRGFVWRGANGTDDVCVTPESRARVAQENATAASRIDSKGAYGPNSCMAGYVWREAFNADVVCVTPEVRALVRQENQRIIGAPR